MRKIVIILLALGLFTACKSKENSNEDKTENKAKDDYQKKSSDDGNKEVDYRDADKEDGKMSDPDELDEDGNSKADIESINGQDDSEDFGGWTINEQNKFVRDCLLTAKKNVGSVQAKKYCNCMLDKLQSMNITYSEMEETVSKMSKSELNKLAIDCN